MHVHFFIYLEMILNNSYILLCLHVDQSITDDNIFLLIVECLFYCGCGSVSCVVCHNVDSCERNLEVGGTLRHAIMSESCSIIIFSDRI